MTHKSEGPLHERGKIGAAAAALGLSHKSDDLLELAAPVQEPVTLQPMPSYVHPSWTPEDVQVIAALSARCAQAGNVRTGNQLRENVTRERPRMFKLSCYKGLTAAIEKTARIKAGTLPPIVPARQYQSLADTGYFSDEYAIPEGLVPPVIERAALDAMNGALADLCAEGFSSVPEGMRFKWVASAKVKQALLTIAQVSGSLSRLVNQLRYYRDAARTGQRPHAPMTYDKRVRLLDEALEQFATRCGREDLTLRVSGLLSAAAKSAWEERAGVEPLPAAFPRTLFEYADPDPSTLSGEDLDRHIQQHPDLNYIERLRAERTRRLTPHT